MTKVINGTTIMVPIGSNEIGEQLNATFYTIYYDDGRVIEKLGKDDWIQIKDPDTFVQAVGKCKDCGKLIFEDEDWDYKENRDGSTAWVCHQTQEGCTKKEGSDDDNS